MIILKIKKIEILSYGKIKNLELNLGPGLNIIFGNNESGKTTIRSFIFNMLYGGTTPGSNRANYTKDYEKYIPWDTTRFEGNILVNDEGYDYLLHRNFQKKNEYFSVRNLIDGSNAREKFCVDQTRRVQVIGDDFFGITENTLRDLFLISENVEMEDNLSDDLKERIINQISTKSEKVSISDVTERIKNNTDTRDIRREIRNLKSRIDDIDKRISENYSFEKEDNLERLSLIDEQLKKLKTDEEKFQIKINELLENNGNIDEKLENKNVSFEENYLINEINKLEKYKKFPVYIIPIILLITGAFNYYLTHNMFMLIVILALAILSYSIISNKKRIKNEKLKNLYHKLDIIRDSEFSSYGSISNLKNDIEILDNIKTKKTNLMIHRESILREIQVEKSKSNSLEDLRRKRNKLKTELEELDFNRKMGIEAIEIITQLTKKSFRNISQTLIEDASYFLSYITDNKYEKLYITETGDISVYDTEIRRIVDIYDLSKGTISQIYLSYRLALIENSGIEFPVIIDEGLSFYDKNRQKSALKLLEQISEKHQIIFFTNNYDEYLEYKNELIGNFIEL